MWQIKGGLGALTLLPLRDRLQRPSLWNRAGWSLVFDQEHVAGISSGTSGLGHQKPRRFCLALSGYSLRKLWALVEEVWHLETSVLWARPSESFRPAHPLAQHHPATSVDTTWNRRITQPNSAKIPDPQNQEVPYCDCCFKCWVNSFGGDQ